MKLNKKDIGKRMEGLRENHKPYLHQKELAAILGVTQQMISNAERGKTMPSLDLLIKISQYFGVTIDYIITGKTDNSPEIEKIKLLVDQLQKAIKKI